MSLLHTSSAFVLSMSTLALLALAPGTVESARAGTGPGEISILYNASVRGELIDCGCPSRPLGGLARRARYVDHIREQHPHTVLLDAGNLFGDPAQDTLEQSRFLAEQTAKMGYRVVGVGPFEIGHGVEEVRRAAEATGMAFVSANLADANGKLLFPSHRIVEENGVKIAVTSVYDPALVRAPYDAKTPNLQAAPVIETLRTLLPALNAEADLVVVLSNLNGSAGVDLLRTLGDDPSLRIDFLVEGMMERQYANPRKFGESRILAANARGKYIGQIDVVVQDSEIVDVVNTVHPLDIALTEEPEMAAAVKSFMERYPTVVGER